MKGNSNQADLHDAKRGGAEHFPKMKTKSGGNIQVRVNVVDVVEAPKEQDFVIQKVPVTIYLSSQRGRKVVKGGRYVIKRRPRRRMHCIGMTARETWRTGLPKR